MYRVEFYRGPLSPLGATYVGDGNYGKYSRTGVGVCEKIKSKNIFYTLPWVQTPAGLENKKYYLYTPVHPPYTPTYVEEK